VTQVTRKKKEKSGNGTLILRDTSTIQATLDASGNASEGLGPDDHWLAGWRGGVGGVGSGTAEAHRRGLQKV
jgi:hypothetical protein